MKAGDERWTLGRRTEISVVLRSLSYPLVHRVEVDAEIIGLGVRCMMCREKPLSILKAMPSRRSATQQTEVDKHTTSNRFAAVGTPFHGFRLFQRPP